MPLPAAPLLPRLPASRRLAFAAKLVGALLIAVATGWLTYLQAFETAIQQMRGNAGHRLDLYAASLEREIDKYARYPYILGFDASVVQLLRTPTDPLIIDRANRYLERLNDRIGTLDAYVVGKDGTVIASSNWNHWDSFVGRDLSYRPYYQNAVIDRVERFYGIGTTNRQPGYFLATALHDGPIILGVAAVKVSLEQLERSWTPAESPAILSDEHGVVMLSSVPAWKYGTLAPLDDVARRQISATQLFNERALEPIGMQVERELDAHTRIVRFGHASSGLSGAFATSGLFLAQMRAMPDTPWNLTVFSDLDEASNLARLEAVLGSLAMVLAIGLFGAFRQRQSHVRELLAAREALQRAHDHLENEVADRTAALSASNAQLQLEIEERSRTERKLRDAQSGLVQAGKLAGIGQLSAGLAHELNQPLAALATLTGNSVRFLERGDLDTVRTNLERIRPLVERMGNLTGELKTFARKSSGETQRVLLRKTIDNTLFLLNHRIVRGPVAIDVRLAEPDLAVRCDPNRLEQVLINLVANAIDAMEGQPDQWIGITAHQVDGLIEMTVHDHGPGLPIDRLENIFEPFFTTKAPGLGLGLGLAISAGIVRDFGGELFASNAPEGGALFRLTIPADKGTP